MVALNARDRKGQSGGGWRQLGVCQPAPFRKPRWEWRLSLCAPSSQMPPIVTPVLGISAEHHRDSCPAEPGGASLEAGCWFLGADEAPLEETGRGVTAGNRTPCLGDTPFLPAEK